MSKLPDKPSELLRLAVQDLEAVEKDPWYEVNMNCWHDPLSDSEGTCAVCLAGAVMARTLGCDPSRDMHPDYLCEDKRDADKLLALEKARLGFWNEFLSLCRIGPWRMPTGLPTMRWSYHNSPILFKAALREAADRLEEVGL